MKAKPDTRYAIVVTRHHYDNKKIKTRMMLEWDSWGEWRGTRAEAKAKIKKTIKENCENYILRHGEASMPTYTLVLTWD